MNQIPVVFLHTTTQVAAGLVVGTIVDGVFPEPSGPIKSGDWKSFIVCTAEVSAQLIVDGLVTVAYTDAMLRMPAEMQDRTMGTAYMLTLMHAQPKLTVKMGRMCGYARDVFYSVVGHKADEINVVRGTPTSNKHQMRGGQKDLANAYL